MIVYAVRRKSDGKIEDTAIHADDVEEAVPILFANRKAAVRHCRECTADPTEVEIVSAKLEFQTKGERRMSTNDVPGANPANRDELAMGCWAEHKDGSLIFVKSTEAGRVIYEMFDVAKDPIIRYVDAMPETSFKATFTWEPESKKAAGKKTNEKWTWHDKTPFPWDRVIKRGFDDGVSHASADGIRTAAERVAESLRLRAREISGDEYAHRVDRIEPARRDRDYRRDDRDDRDHDQPAGGTASVIWGKIRRAIDSAVKEFDR